MSGYFSNINIKLFQIIADKMDTEDGKDSIISGSIWNKYFDNENKEMSVNESKTLTLSEAVENLKILTKEQFDKLCSKMNINITDCNTATTENDVEEASDTDESKPFKKIDYSDGNTKYTEEYDNKGNLIKKTVCLTTDEYEEITEYNKDNNITRQVRTELGYKTVTVYNKDGDRNITEYDQDGFIVSEFCYAGDDLIEETYYENGIKSYTKKYENGKLINSVSYYNGEAKPTYRLADGYPIHTQYDDEGNIIKEITLKPDGHVGLSAQQEQGDCYLMSAINGILQVAGGNDYLDSLIKIGENGYTVTLPGAKIAANHMLSKNIPPEKMYITGEYTFTEDEIKEIISKAGTQYSFGDADTMLLEAAFERYREEVLRTLTENNLEEDITVAGMETANDPDEMLSGGWPHDAMFILTGLKSKIYFSDDDLPYVKPTSIKEGKNTEDTLEKIAGENNITIEDIDTQRKNAKELKSLTRSKAGLKRLMKTIKNDNKDGVTNQVAICTFDTGEFEGHAYTIKAITDDSVCLINPYGPEIIIELDIEKFLSVVSYMSITEIPIVK